jgi:hypothetical protein
VSLIFDEIRGDRRRFRTGFPCDSQQEVQLLGLFVIQVDKSNSKTEPMPVMPHLTFQIKPVVVRKEHTKGDDFACHHLAHGVEITTAFGKVRYAGGMFFLATLPNRIELNAQPWFRAPIIHDVSIIEVLARQAKKNQLKE